MSLSRFAVVASIVVLAGCAEPDPRNLWTRSNTLPVDVIEGVELTKIPTPDEEKKLIVAVEKEISKYMSPSGFSPIIDEALKQYSAKAVAGQTAVTKDDVKIVIEDEAANEPGPRELQFVLRLSRRPITVDVRAASARMRVVLGLGEITAAPRDAIEFPKIVRTVLATTLKRIGTEQATKLGLMDASHGG